MLDLLELIESHDADVSEQNFKKLAFRDELIPQHGEENLKGALRET